MQYITAELNYTLIEKEFLVVIYAINKFQHYIMGYPTFVRTDHSTIRYMMNKTITHGQIKRWFLLLQEFDMTIVDKLGRDNVVTDFLCRLNINSKDTLVEDIFPNEHIFAMSTHTPWYVDVSNYLAVRKVPHHLSHREQRRIIQQSTHYTWIEGYLLYTRLD